LEWLESIEDQMFEQGNTLSLVKLNKTPHGNTKSYTNSKLKLSTQCSNWSWDGWSPNVVESQLAFFFLGVNSATMVTKDFGKFWFF
jgi:hypothetical protein